MSNLLLLPAILCFYTTFIIKIFQGAFKLKLKKGVAFVVYFLAVGYVYLSNIFSLWMPKVLNDYFWDIPVIHWIGIVLTIIGVGFYIHTVATLNQAFRIGIDTETQEKLKTDGVFKISRNPIYISFYTFAFGLFLSCPNIGTLTIFISLLVIFHFTILDEENFLKEHYGEEYTEYCKKVRRYL